VLGMSHFKKSLFTFAINDSIASAETSCSSGQSWLVREPFNVQWSCLALSITDIKGITGAHQIFLNIIALHARFP
jgi:hypothetical protein